MSKEGEFRCEVLVRFQVALLNMVTPSLRGVTVGWGDKKIYAICFYDCDIGDEEEECASEIETEIMASFPDHHVRVVAEAAKDISDNLNSRTLKAWVYSRMEKSYRE
ncbi:MAG: hypothetical protein OEV92_03825 [Nitrospinota bacterium]|nr:hypothetical protein [Nitrospinota bacterium]